jgi:hypothetical protein
MKKTTLVFRYDSTPHFPQSLYFFPISKHLPNDVISCHKPEITQVFKEATQFLQVNKTYLMRSPDLVYLVVRDRRSCRLGDRVLNPTSSPGCSNLVS